MQDFSEQPKEWDVFISHASEDKDEIVRSLALALQAAGLRVWYDEFSLKLGDSLRKSIDYGLANSRFGIVVLSHSFFAKHWPTQELNGLANREVNGTRVILPIWHKVTADDVRTFSPMLADRIAANSEKALDLLVHDVVEVITPASLPVTPPPKKILRKAFWPGLKTFMVIIGALSLILALIGLWPQLIGSGSRPKYFSGPIAAIYENLDYADKKKLGRFIREPYLYTGPKASTPGIGPGTNIVRFANGLAVYLKSDEDTNPGSAGGRSFFIQANGDVKHWWLAKHYPRESPCWKGERPASPPDRCKVVSACLDPRSGIGSVWRCEWTIQSSVGKPTTCETNFIIQIQEFERGFLITNVPMFSSRICEPEAKLVQTESYVLFKNDEKPVGNIVMQGDGFQIRSDNVGVETPDRWPIWTCTDAAPQLCIP